METLKFKTNINCGGCIAKIAPFMTGNEVIKSWEVDTASPQKILTVETGSGAAAVQEVVTKAGFTAEVLSHP